MPTSTVYLTDERDVPLLAFLWRWKLSTTAALARRFFPDAAVSTAYRRLWALEQQRFIRAHADGHGKRFVWGLDQKGFAVVRDLLPELREAGYKSEHLHHDLLVSAIHVGEWLCEVPPGVELFSEQQLRRYHHDHYPTWVPKDDSHRPDGYWNVPDGTTKKTVALEVELHHQRHARYEAVREFYARHLGIIRVLWTVPTLAAGKNLVHALTESTDGAGSYHDVALISNFRRLGWGAPVVLGPDAGKSVHDVLANMATTRPQHVVAMLLLDTRKSPHRSTSHVSARRPDSSV